MITAKEAREQLVQDDINFISKRIRQAITKGDNDVKIVIKDLHVTAAGLSLIVRILRENGYRVFTINNTFLSIDWG